MKSYERRFEEMKSTIDELNEEVESERRIKLELEMSLRKEHELVVSLLSNLGEEMLKLRDDAKH